MDLQSQIIQYLVTGLTLGSIYAMVGLGFTIIYNATSIINLAQGEFVMFGGLVMVFLTSHPKTSPGGRFSYNPGHGYRHRRSV